jgi:hypothetical protein
METSIRKPRVGPALEVQIVTRPNGRLQSLSVSVGGAAILLVQYLIKGFDLICHPRGSGSEHYCADLR